MLDCIYSTVKNSKCDIKHFVQVSSVSAMTTGYGLYINNGFFTTARFADVHLSGTFLSIETRLNIHSVSTTGGSGVVLSYAFYDTFAVCIVDGKFQVCRV